MGKINLRTLVLWFLLTIIAFDASTQNALFDKNYDTTKNVLILLHPTVYGIKKFVWLKEHNIVELGNTVLIGLYFENERYDYKKSIEYLNANQVEDYYLQKISGQLKSEDLFTHNQLSADFEKVFMYSKGIIFFGGPDIPPYIYGEKTNLITQIEDPFRHFFEASFLFHLLGGKQNEDFIPLLENNPDYIVWAFCLGLQTMNVATGGTLIQDIPSEIYGILKAENVFSLDENQIHKNYYNVLTYNEDLTGANLHQITLLENSFFTNTLKFEITDKPMVYSYHHQCIKDLGKGLVPIATSIDEKIIEAVKHEEYKNVLAFQFHPEKFSLYDAETKYQFTLNDTSRISYYSLITNSISMDFNKSIWKYFSEIFNN